MATTDFNPLTSKFHGQLGPFVYYVVGGQQRIRTRPSHVRNPRSQLQTAHRTRFSAANTIAAIFNGAYQVGYKKAVQGLDARSAFVKHVYHDVLSDDAILNPDRLKVSQGSLQIFQPSRVDLDGSRLSLRWSLYGGASSDRLCVCVYSYSQGYSQFFPDVASRADHRVSVNIEGNFLSDHLYIYCFWHNPTFHKVSTSVVAAEFNNPDSDEAKLLDLTKHLQTLSLGWKNPLRRDFLISRLRNATNKISPLKTNEPNQTITPPPKIE